MILLVCADVPKEISRTKKHVVIRERGDFMGAGASAWWNVSSILNERSIDSGGIRFKKKCLAEATTDRDKMKSCVIFRS